MPTCPDHIVRLTSRPTELDAGIVVAALAEHGIRATATGATTAGFRAEAPGWVHVLVAEDDLPGAAALLAELDASHGNVDWSQVDVGEPEPEEANHGELPGIVRLGFLRRVAAVLVVAYLAWLSAGVLRGVVHLVLGDR